MGGPRPWTPLPVITPEHRATTPRVNRIDHVGIAVHDADAAARLYVERLGLPVVHDEIAEEPGVRLVYLDAGNTFVQVVQPIRPCRVSEWLARNPEGLHHICFSVDDIEHTLAELGDSAPVFLGGRSRRTCFLTGTAHGTLIELTEQHPRTRPEPGAS